MCIPCFASLRSAAARLARGASTPRSLAPWALGAALAALLTCGGCSRGEGSSEGAIRIGAYNSMTGSEATFGQSTHNGIVLALEELQAQGWLQKGPGAGRSIQLINYDTAGKTQEAGNAVSRLITQDRVIAVLGEVASSLSIAGGRVAQQYGVPMISPSSTNVQVTQIGDMVFRVCFIDSFQGFVAAKFLREKLALDRVAVLFDQSQAYSKGLKDDFVKAFRELGGTIVAEQAFTGGDQDFTAQLTSIRSANPQAIYIPGYYTDVGNIAIQARRLGLGREIPLVGGDGWDSVKLAEIGGDAIEGSYYSNHYSPDQPSPEVAAFVEKYRQRFGQVPDGLAALGYDAANLLFDAMGRARSLDGRDLAAAIAATKEFTGVTGTISIDPNRNASKAAVVVQMQGGRPVFVAAVEPER